MRRDNEAFVCERHPMPSIDDTIQDIERNFFSKIDLDMAYHQIQLYSDFREIATFSAPGKTKDPLGGGVNMASEKLQQIMNQVIQEHTT